MPYISHRVSSGILFNQGTWLTWYPTAKIMGSTPLALPEHLGTFFFPQKPPSKSWLLIPKLGWVGWGWDWCDLITYPPTKNERAVFHLQIFGKKILEGTEIPNLGSHIMIRGIGLKRTHSLDEHSTT